MLLLLTAPVENLTGCDDIVCAFSQCNFNLHDQSTKKKCVENICIYFLTLCSRWKTRYVKGVKTSLSIYSITLAFQLLILKSSIFVHCRLLRRKLFEVLSWVSNKRILQFSHIFFQYVVAGCQFWDL